MLRHTAAARTTEIMVPPNRKALTPLGSVSGNALAPALKRRGFTAGDIVAQWPAIVGAHLATLTLPERIKWPRRPGLGDSDAGADDAATLVLRVDGPVAIEIQHAAPQILERINVYFGYRAIGKLKIIQAPLARPARPQRRPAPLDEEATAAIAARVASVQDPALRDALAKLGRNIATEHRDQTAQVRRVTKP